MCDHVWIFEEKTLSTLRRPALAIQQPMTPVALLPALYVCTWWKRTCP
jgi:hypothetical protein